MQARTPVLSNQATYCCRSKSKLGLAECVQPRHRRSRPPVPRRRSSGANVAVAQVRRLFRRKLVLLLQLSQLVLGIGRHRTRVSRLQVDAVETRGVQTEDRLFDWTGGATKWCEPVFLLHVVGYLQPPQRFDLPLRRTIPYAISAPDNVIGS